MPQASSSNPVRLLPLRRRDGFVRAVALLDESDQHLVTPLRWYLSGNGYVVGRVGANPELIYLHRLLLGLTPGDGWEADHINHDRLDNRRANLRTVTRRENGQNLPHMRGHSRFRGVSWDGRCWVAYAVLNDHQHSLGRFEREEDAAAAAAAFRAEHMPGSVEAMA